MSNQFNSVQQFQAALIGNPNSGKSTLFNRLTGSSQHVGNWPGVTVEQKTGKLYNRDTQTTLQIIDLPGCYSIIATQDMSRDERVTCEFILNSPDTLYINVVDASHLQRDLYLTLQLIEIGKPIVVALNCMDLAKKANIKIDVEQLSELLGCPVVPIVAKTGDNLVELQRQVLNVPPDVIPGVNVIPGLTREVIPSQLQHIIQMWQQHMPVTAAMRVLEGDVLHVEPLLKVNVDIAEVKQQLVQEIGIPLDLFLAQQRRKLLQSILQKCVVRQAQAKSISKRIDSVVLHKVFGPMIFVAIMYLMFTFAINLGGFLQQGFDQTSEAIFIVSFANWLTKVGAAPWLINLLAYGIGKGINITVTFIPVLTTMFISLGILESSGYMTRAAFIVDRVMRIFGLPGKSFVPMIVGFGCNVPAVMGARTMAHRYERILTIMMIPFMSCSARLAIYAIFVAAFFPIGGQNVIFSLYVIGILVAALTGLALRTAVLPEKQATSLIEMPDYRWPTARVLARQVWNRLKSFLIKASGIIIVLCVLINGIGYNNLEKVGKTITPVFAPIGISSENWPATVGLLTGLLAKEAVIGTLNSVYSVAAGAEQIAIAENTLSNAAENEMIVRFGGVTAAYAYLLFTLLYFPCVSVVAVIAKELNKRWAMFSVLWSTSLAYIVAALYYQIATWPGFYSQASVWIASLSITLVTIYIATRLVVKRSMQRRGKYKAVPTLVTVSNFTH